MKAAFGRKLLAFGKKEQISFYWLEGTAQRRKVVQKWLDQSPFETSAPQGFRVCTSVLPVVQAFLVETSVKRYFGT
jgi:hypothetical protein